ncbi:MAG: B12-binding domain-containing radical SAM protein [Planctomycetes bacterium]|nr:B12-binding domain-containing radical SAM protein [Planctomycetota bacterium]
MGPHGSGVQPEEFESLLLPTFKFMLDFLFITSPTNARNPHPPYYFLYLSAYLREKGLRVKIVDVKGGDRPHELEVHYSTISQELRCNPSRFVGLAAFHSDYPAIMRLGGIVKLNQPDTTLLVGNAHSTISPQDFIFKESNFDVAVLGEGEETCYDLWCWYDKPVTKRLDEVAGIAYMSYVLKEPEYVKTKKRRVMDMGDLPSPSYDLVDMDYYLYPQKLIIRRIYTSMVCIFAGRGCPFDCDFCAANNVWQANEGKACRLRPVGNVINEIVQLKEFYSIDFFYLFDDMFGMSKKWMNGWFEWKSKTETYSSRKSIVEIPYATQTRADICSEEMIRGLKATGCIQLDIGVESGSQQLLDQVNKGITLDQIRHVFSWCKKYKLRSFATMLLNLPGETSKDLESTHQFLKEIKPSAGVIFGVTTPYPGTKIYEDQFKPKLTTDEYHLLIGNRLNPLERFRLSDHKLDLEVIWDRWNREFKATPMFERMWAAKPYQSQYWQAVLRSERCSQYVKCWGKDLVKTFLLWWIHKLGMYRLLKRIQYRRRKNE